MYWNESKMNGKQHMQKQRRLVLHSPISYQVKLLQMQWKKHWNMIRQLKKVHMPFVYPWLMIAPLEVATLLPAEEAEDNDITAMDEDDKQSRKSNKQTSEMDILFQRTSRKKKEVLSIAIEWVSIIIIQKSQEKKKKQQEQQQPETVTEPTTATQVPALPKPDRIMRDVLDALSNTTQKKKKKKNKNKQQAEEKNAPAKKKQKAYFWDVFLMANMMMYVSEILNKWFLILSQHLFRSLPGHASTNPNKQG